MNSKERQTNFERTLFDQTTYPDIYPLFIEELLHAILFLLQFSLVLGHFFGAMIFAINNGFLKLIKNCQSICEGTEKLKEI
jgi:hypothetical protein